MQNSNAEIQAPQYAKIAANGGKKTENISRTTPISIMPYTLPIYLLTNPRRCKTVSRT